MDAIRILVLRVKVNMRKFNSEKSLTMKSDFFHFVLFLSSM